MACRKIKVPNIWEDSSVKFLDPFTKSGVFLREITKRLISGLEGEIPDLQERVDHILNNQVFGIAITRITALLARRSVYCSKDASSAHSIVKSFENYGGAKSPIYKPNTHGKRGNVHFVVLDVKSMTEALI